MAMVKAKAKAKAKAIGFNEDLTIEILLRLPVKSVLRFKTVSKRWLSIVSSRRFRQIHSSSSIGRPPPTGLFYNLNMDCLSLDGQILRNCLPFFHYSVAGISSSSGGLLLLECCHKKSSSGHTSYIVCNPTTKEFKWLSIPQLRLNLYPVSQTLAFDPSKSPYYKVLFLCKQYSNNRYKKQQIDHTDEEFQIGIYSSETETFSLKPEVTLVGFRSSGIYFNDAVHWISKDDLRYFDVKRECMNECALPDNSLDILEHVSEYQGHLHLVTFKMPHIEVNELKSDYSGWSVKYRMNMVVTAMAFPQPQIHFRICRRMFSVYSVLRDANGDLTMVFLVDRMVMAYNFKKKTCKMLRDETGKGRANYVYIDGHLFEEATRGRYDNLPLANQYIETLACV